MCVCDPSCRTPFCGKPGCESPPQKPRPLEDALPFGDPVETQRTVTAWQNETFPAAKGNFRGYAQRCFEEMVELLIASGHSISDIFDLIEELVMDPKWVNRGDDDRTVQREAVPGELADVLIVLYGCADAAGVELQDEVDKKMRINRARKWKPRLDGSGHADHVKGSP